MYRLDYTRPVRLHKPPATYRHPRCVIDFTVIWRPSPETVSSVLVRQTASCAPAAGATIPVDTRLLPARESRASPPTPWSLNGNLRAAEHPRAAYMEGVRLAGGSTGEMIFRGAATSSSGANWQAANSKSSHVDPYRQDRKGCLRARTGSTPIDQQGPLRRAFPSAADQYRPGRDAPPQFVAVAGRSVNLIGLRVS